MNTRRQKIWLVSMLSLMVVLSAYYLFTDDIGQVSDPDSQDGNMTAAGHLEATYDSQFADDEHYVLSDEEILAQVESMQASAGVSAKFDQLYMQRDNQLKERFDELNRIVTDPSQSTEAVTQAYTEHDMLEEQYLIVQSLEEQLMEDYGNAIIEEENGEWHVRVLADHLEKSQAVSIIEMVADELGVDNRQVFVTMMN